MLLNQFQTLKKENHETELLEMRSAIVSFDGNGVYVLMKDKGFEKGFIEK